MKIRVHLIGGSIIDSDVPDNFSIPAMAQSIQIAGFFASDHVYFTREQINFIIRTDIPNSMAVSSVAGMTPQ